MEALWCGDFPDSEAAVVPYVNSSSRTFALTRPPPMDRRRLLHLLGAATAAPLFDGAPFLSALGDIIGASPRPRLARAPLRLAPVVRGPEFTLRAQERVVEIAPGVNARVWSPGDGPVGPTIETRVGERLAIRLENALPEHTILHWHGLRVPEAADGHPRLAIAPGQHYDYDIPIIDRAGLYWYHSHAHHRTGIQAYRGMAGIFIVRDESESQWQLPAGAHELPLLIQDRRLTSTGEFEYNPVMHEVMEGYFGDTPFVNGIRLPMHEVETTTYRLRLVNATTSRVLRIALSNGASLRLIGGDGGLFERPEIVNSIDLATGERADVLVDFSKVPVGQSVSLVSQAFPPPAGGMGMGRGMGRMGGGIPQGGAMTLLEFRVARAVTPTAWTSPPATARTIAPPERSTRSPARTRTFRFDSMAMQHAINGRAFEMERMDVTVPFGETELWQFENASPFPHPVHVHEVQFDVVQRIGGRGRIMPWERGPKDTVLVMPGEQVRVHVTFDTYRGRFLMHCHNLVHEDAGMMLNFEVV